jgi:hypothetical protein
MSRHEADLDALIRSARSERPRGRLPAQRRLFRRLALGGGAALLLARVSHAVSPLLRAPKLTLGILGLVTIGVAVAAGSSYTAVPTGESPAPALVSVATSPVSTVGEHSAPAHSTPAHSAPAHSTPAQPAVPTLSVDALPTAPQPLQLPRSVEIAAAPRDGEDDLAKETASVSRIRSQLGARNFSGALAGVRTHRGTFPRGLLEQEVTVLEIEAHQGLGQEDRACALGRSFLDAHPTSAHRTRVSGLLRSCAR